MSDFYALKNASKINLTTWFCPCCDFRSCLPWSSDQEDRQILPGIWNPGQIPHKVL